MQMRAKYDIVHLRLFFAIVKDAEPARRVVEQLAKLLKPGGWVQWDELDVGGSFVLRVEGWEAPVMEETVEVLGGFGEWVGQIPELMEECGFVDDRVERFEERNELARAFLDNHLAKDEEVAVGRIASGDEDREGTRLLENVSAMVEESRRGVVICTPLVVFTARMMECDGSATHVGSLPCGRPGGRTFENLEARFSRMICSCRYSDRQRP